MSRKVYPIQHATYCQKHGKGCICEGPSWGGAAMCHIHGMLDWGIGIMYDSSGRTCCSYCRTWERLAPRSKHYMRYATAAWMKRKSHHAEASGA